MVFFGVFPAWAAGGGRGPIDQVTSTRKFYPIDPDLFDQCLSVLISGYFVCGIYIDPSDLGRAAFYVLLIGRGPQ